MLGDRNLAVSEQPTAIELLKRLRGLRGRIPNNFHFDLLEANEREID